MREVSEGMFPGVKTVIERLPVRPYHALTRKPLPSALVNRGGRPFRLDHDILVAKIRERIQRSPTIKPWPLFRSMTKRRPSGGGDPQPDSPYRRYLGDKPVSYSTFRRYFEEAKNFKP
jgi:hypothetical protein